MQHLLIKDVSPSNIHDFFRSKIRQYTPENEDLSYLISGDSFDSFSELRKLSECTYDNTDELLVFTCRHNGTLSARSSKKKQYDLAKKIFASIVFLITPKTKKSSRCLIICSLAIVALIFLPI